MIINKQKISIFLDKFIKINTYEIACMGLMLALFSVLKYITYSIFKGPLNFSIEYIFWIIIGIVFGPIKGAIFSIICDTIFTLFTSGIIYWMIEYAAIPPIISLVSWLIYFGYKENNKNTIFIMLINLLVSITTSIIIFTYQLIAKIEFKYEDVGTISNVVAYILIAIINITIIFYISFCLIKFKTTKNWQYIKYLYIFSMLFIIIVIFRWLWGPYAFIAFSKRFFSPNMDFSKQYPLTLIGIVMKSCITLPIATIILLPTIKVIEIHKINNNFNNKFA